MNKLFKKYKRLFNRTALKPLIVVFALLATSALVYAVTYVPYVSSTSGFKSTTNTTITVAEYGVGKNVANSTGKNYFIPTKTKVEWDSFVSAVPSGISLTGLSWYESGFGSCSASCGDGTQAQSVWCVGTDGATTTDSYCTPTTKPVTSKICNLGSCVTYSWQPDGTYGTCSKGSYICGPGTKSTIYKCKGSDGAWYGDTSCSGAKPVASVSCTINNTTCSDSQTFTAAGTYSFRMPNVASVTVEVVGAGGGGGGGNGYGYGLGHGAGGGGGGHVTSGNIGGVVPGGIVSITVGTGGTGGAAGGNNAYGTNGGAGGYTKVTYNNGSSYYDFTAYGGGGGGRAEYDLSAPAVGGPVGGSGGTAGGAGGKNEVVSIPCVGSRRACDGVTNYSYYYGASGAGGNSMNGSSIGGAGLPRVKHIGDTYPTSADYGISGIGYGAGGSGATSDHFGGGGGGSGNPGYVKISW